MSEQILASIIGSNEAEALGIVEPFNGSGQLLGIAGSGGFG